MKRWTVRLVVAAIAAMALFFAFGAQPAHAQGATGEIEFRGLLQQWSGTTMIVGARTVNVAAAEIKAGVQVGVMVKVHATLVNGVYVAREVEPSVRAPRAVTTATPQPGRGGSDDGPNHDLNDDHGGRGRGGDDRGGDDDGGGRGRGRGGDD
ncbi:MAG: hypothetical protein IT323_03220 [Anaerolineae bacterium]|nr:hypothetical protein [Anaerolineae bacterium]